ncbi:Hypothetical protein PSEBR_m1740 [Pseudomonas brassicacearum subsp. brassicacearum NFM421]|uniref:Uncharacterized protein n=1 Tax=Pseudomonas brassicacearum (strain NFM421) TaxID=994484 RepID=F2K738_PSEBN|nr:Hypothetical protein PSEBR_m1740 [Pseudomonas brassicacearum subsp. brassicacearum NFM421]
MGARLARDEGPAVCQGPRRLFREQALLPPGVGCVYIVTTCPVPCLSSMEPPKRSASGFSSISRQGQLR